MKFAGSAQPDHDGPLKPQYEVPTDVALWHEMWRHGRHNAEGETGKLRSNHSMSLNGEKRWLVVLWVEGSGYST